MRIKTQMHYTLSLVALVAACGVSVSVWIGAAVAGAWALSAVAGTFSASSGLLVMLMAAINAYGRERVSVNCYACNRPFVPEGDSDYDICDRCLDV